MEVSVEVPVRWVDLDFLGHVNNAVFLNYLEEARDRLLEGCLGEAFANVVIARIEIDYRHEIAKGVTRVQVSAAVESIGTSSITTVEQIRLPEGTLCSQSRTVNVVRAVDGSGGRALSDVERAALEAHLRETPGSSSGR